MCKNIFLFHLDSSYHSAHSLVFQRFSQFSALLPSDDVKSTAPRRTENATRLVWDFNRCTRLLYFVNPSRFSIPFGLSLTSAATAVKGSFAFFNKFPTVTARFNKHVNRSPKPGIDKKCFVPFDRPFQQHNFYFVNEDIEHL